MADNEYWQQCDLLLGPMGGVYFILSCECYIFGKVHNYYAVVLGQLLHDMFLDIVLIVYSENVACVLAHHARYVVS